jgi:hypothetical protein
VLRFDQTLAFRHGYQLCDFPKATSIFASPVTQHRRAFSLASTATHSEIICPEEVCQTSSGRFSVGAADDQVLEIWVIRHGFEDTLPTPSGSRLNRRKTPFDSPKTSGRSRQGAPVRTIQSTPSTNIRVLRPVEPRCPRRPMIRPQIRLHCSSLRTRFAARASFLRCYFSKVSVRDLKATVTSSHIG